MITRTLILLAVLWIPFGANAEELADLPIAEVVWPEFDGTEHLLLYSRYDGENWQHPGDILYRSDNALFTPIFTTTQANQPLLIWAQVQKHKTVLMARHGQRQANSIVWQKPQLLSARGLENLGPTVVQDRNQALWLFWAVSTTAPSDVYYSRYENQRWSDPQRVHPANQVPDNRPEAWLNEAGNVEVRWTSFDLDIGDYTVENQTFLVETREPTQLKQTDLIDPESVPAPEFVPGASRTQLFFARNTLTQQRLIEP